MVAHWLAELDGRKVTVEVPASSANLGAGYDCLGVAPGDDEHDPTGGPRLEPRRRSTSPSRARVATSCPGTVTTGSSRGSRRRSRPPAANSPKASAGGSSCTTTSRSPVGSARRRRRPSVVSWPATRCSVTRSPRRTCSGSRPTSRAIRITPRPRSWAGSRSVPASTTAWKPCASTSRASCGPCSFIPELRLETGAMRDALPAKVPLVDAVANLGAVGLGVAGLAAGRTDLLAPADRGSAPRAVSREGLPGAPASRRSRPRGRRPGGVPVGVRLDDHRLRRFDDRVHADRGGHARRGRGP